MYNVHVQNNNYLIFLSTSWCSSISSLYVMQCFLFIIRPGLLYSDNVVLIVKLKECIMDACIIIQSYIFEYQEILYKL